MNDKEWNGNPALQSFYHNRFNEFSLFAERLFKLISTNVLVTFCQKGEKTICECTLTDFNSYHRVTREEDNPIDAFFAATDAWGVGKKSE